MYIENKSKSSNLFDNKTKLINNLSIVKYWLNENINKNDTLNKLYYYIYIYMCLDKSDKKQEDDDSLALASNNIKNFNKYLQKVQNREAEYSKSDVIKNILKCLKYNKKFEHVSLPYDININFFDKIKERKHWYFHNCDLEIRFLPNFLNYEYTIILLWISFCYVIDKKNTSYSNHFLHDIYMFQNEKDNKEKIALLILILGKIMNYIQYFDYKKKSNEKKNK